MAEKKDKGGRPRVFPKGPLLSVMSMGNVPKDIRDSLEEMIAKKKSIGDLQRHLKINGFLVSKPNLKKWLEDLEIQKIADVHDLPPELQDKVKQWWVTRRDWSACIEDVAKEGIQANRSVLEGWYGQLLRDEAQAEIAGNFEVGKTSISKELEAWALTGTLDKAVDAIMRSNNQLELRSPADFGKMAEVIIKVVNANISRRKLDMDEVTLLKRARKEMVGQIRETLAAYPELVRELAEVLDEDDKDEAVNS